MGNKRWIVIVALFAATFAVGALGDGSLLRSVWPALVAFAGIVLLKEAAAGLALGVAAAALLVAHGNPASALRTVMMDHLFPAMQGPWKIGSLVFTLLIGAFAGVIERSGGFEALLRRILSGRAGERGLLGGVFGVGLLCFFDGLASSLVSGRIARPMIDKAGISRERLAWVVDSTGSPVACVAFISTWISMQLSNIDAGLKEASFAAEPYAMFFRSVPANAYCLLTLLLVALSIAWNWQPRIMRKCRPHEPDESVTEPAGDASPLAALVPVLVLVLAIFAGFPMFSEGAPDLRTVEGWKQSFGGNAGPYALVFGSLVAWLAAFLMFPRGRKRDAAEASLRGAGSLLPALVVLVCAWTLGSLFSELGTTKHISTLLSDHAAAPWMPLLVFLVGSAMAFTTGSSWATMGLLMPLALPATLVAGAAAGMDPGALRDLTAMVIGAVFGGATLGDHCSPFSDTTIVSALASGCRTIDHVVTQLPFAGIAAACSALAYSLMAWGLPSAAATAAAAAALAGFLAILRRRG
ncbi:MAG: hypothetical protein H7A48_07950 [Akkermansiaceae bacterium]|nr:hypothetical protein [Akkermansiaceae bacterium]